MTDPNRARKLRNAAAASSHLQALRIDLLTDGNDLDAALVEHMGTVLAGVLGRVVVQDQHAQSCEVGS